MKETVEYMAHLSTAIISDALFRMGHKDRTMAARIKPIDPAMRVAGPAFTAKAYPGGTHACDEALAACEKGDVLVIDGGGYLDAVLWGEIFSHMAAVKGVLGVVIDGAVRDVDGIVELGFPVFAAGITPAAGTGDRLGEVGIPVSCGGVVVNPGDWVYGDRLGVVVVPEPKLVETRQHCEELLLKERELLAKLRNELGTRGG